MELRGLDAPCGLGLEAVGNDSQSGALGYESIAHIRSMAYESVGDSTATTSVKRSGTTRSAKRRKLHRPRTPTVACTLLLTSLPMAQAQECISLEGSSACPAFNASSISTSNDLVGLFPFLSDVSDLSSFDSQLQDYILGDFVQARYERLIGCDNVDLSSDTDDFYARYTTSVLCNAIIQNSIEPCGLEDTASRPLCADSCASYAQSEQEIAASDVCGNAGQNANAQIRADFTNCALPADALAGSCIPAYENQPNDCGYATNLGGLCSYCAASSPNSTDSCCVFAESESRCEDVTLPVIATSALSAIVTTLTATPTTSPSQSSTASGTPLAAAGESSNPGLTGGQIAGIVVGAVLGALLLLALIIGGCLLMRRRRSDSPATSVFNQPAASQQQPAMAYNNDGGRDQERAGLAVLPGGRVARMSALERSDTSDHQDTSFLAGGGGYNRKSSSSEDGAPDYRAVVPPPKRSGSLSSSSQLALAGAEQDTSPSTYNYTSPDSHGQSERLAFFKDYYSQDEIHAGDLVSTLWAYEPRAADEFHLERGDMIKIIGIWDDGWATGVRVRQKAEDWRPPKKFLRDSAQSNTGGDDDDSPTTSDGEGEVKAFPLVCVCVPRHWRRTIEGDSTEGTASNGNTGDFP